MDEVQSMEAMHDIIGILKQETDNLRKKYHELSTDCAVIKTSIYKLENKGTCGIHDDFTKRIETLVTNTEVIKSKIEDIANYKEKTIKLETEINGMKSIKAWIIANLIIVILSIIGVAVTWGELKKQVSINTERLSKIETVLYGR